MSDPYVKRTAPFVVPGTGIKTIEEYFGAAASNDRGMSLAHMVAPSGWSEPYQRPEFDEYVAVIRGRQLVEIDGKRIEVGSGESIHVRKNVRVRYSNPFGEEAEYWSVCVPAFTPDGARREE